MDAAGVDRACVFCIWYGDARRANDMTARLVETHPDRFIGAVYVTPNYPEEMLPELERALDLPGMKYVKLYPAYHAGRVIDDPAFFPVFEWANERGLAVMSHHNDWPQPLRYVALAKRYRNVKWVIAHAGNGPMAQEEAVRAARSADNVYLEASTSWGDHGTIKFCRRPAAASGDRLVRSQPQKPVALQRSLEAPRAGTRAHRRRCARAGARGQGGRLDRLRSTFDRGCARADRAADGVQGGVRGQRGNAAHP